jgi:preprotein translocase subunit YajC
MHLPDPLRLRPEFQQDPKTAPETQQAPPPRTDEFATRDRAGEGAPQGSTEQPGQAQPSSGSDPCLNQLLLILPMLLIFYFLLIRPQQKRDKELRALIAAAQKGDKIVTNSGLHGVITQLDDKTVTIRTDGEGKVKLTFDRAAIGRIVREEKAG